jgi:DNA-binding winged helix-turn-helix (wHTH) protein
VVEKARVLTFGGFHLDPANALLWRGKDRVELSPKPFDVLCYLVQRPGQLVTKDELLDAVWSNIHITESSLIVAVNALRSALTDDPKAPRFIETVTRRGYRFIAPVSVVPSHDVELLPDEQTLTPTRLLVTRPRWLVGREGPLGVLEVVLQQAINGNRQVVFVTGEAGIGKTTLLEMFLERVHRRGVCVL